MSNGIARQALTRSEGFSSISAREIYDAGYDEIQAAKEAKVETFLSVAEQDMI